MKKNLILTIVIFLNVLRISAQTEKVEVLTGNFDSFSASNSIEVMLIKSDQNKVVIIGENVQNVSVKNKKGNLQIKLSIDKAFSEKNTQAQVYYNSTLKDISAGSNAKIESNSAFSQSRLSVNASSGGNVYLNVNLENLDVKVASGAQVQITGTSDSQDVSVVTGGQYNGEDLATLYSKVSVSAGGTIMVDVNKELIANVSMGGTIEYSGNPLKVTQDVRLGGSVVKVDKEVSVIAEHKDTLME